MDFFTRIAEHTPQLNKNDNEILSYCIRNHTEIANLKVTELADRLFISPASVVRFCKKLGFSGYSDFKASLRMDLFEQHADEIFDEAENRLHVQKAVLAILLAGK